MVKKIGILTKKKTYKRIISIKNVLITSFIVLLLIGCAEDLFNDAGNNNNGEVFSHLFDFKTGEGCIAMEQSEFSRCAQVAA